LKSDSAPVRGDGYKSRSLKFRLRANVETSHSVLVGLVVVVCVVGCSEKFSHGMVRSRKPLLMVPLYNTATTVSLLSTCVIQHGYIVFDNIPWPLMESIDSLMLTNERVWMNGWVNIRPLLTPGAIACRACGHLPLITTYKPG
jgi:hypothetical protein